MKYVLLFTALILSSCSRYEDSSDTIQQKQQEKILAEGTSQTGMPAIKNFRERKMLKDIYELRDQNGLTTYTYLFNEMQGKLVFFGETIGYGIPYATQYSNPMKASQYFFYNQHAENQWGVQTIPQADPNGLFTPAAAEGTWVLMKNPNGKEVQPVYIETRIIVSPFKLNIP